ncbi:peptide ABC transporter permease [Sporolactobacillus laevolacticus DSM 442]|uniref:Peptide ABC transporter permease n=2 Tax=Sporolactobacillus laevolacticus TaxID=33018 RepID=V6J811_9BACL|nr:peptide ABC transporter permease [Sporolactobacillus laevolacticus DSM 442]
MATVNQEVSKELFAPADIDHSSSERIAGESVSAWRDSLRRYVKSVPAMVSTIIIALTIVLSIVGPHFFGYGIDDQNINLQNMPPKIPGLTWIPAFDGKYQGVDVYAQKHIKKAYWFGTDALGRDIWTRTWSGTRISLIIALVATLVDIFIGVTYGSISGYIGGKTDTIMQRIIEIIAGIPSLVWIILLILIMQPGLFAITVAITATSWIGMARLIRGEMMKLKNQEFVLASRTLGAKNSRIIFRHLIPNSLGMIIINTMFSIPTAIFFEAFLSFIGLGIRRPQASLGSMINEGFRVLMIYPYQILFPGVIISLLLICFNLMGDGLRDAFDPKLRR